MSAALPNRQVKREYLSRRTRQMTLEYVARHATPITRNIRGLSDSVGKQFFLVIKGDIVPAEWLNMAYRVGARREDHGYAEKASVIMIFPIHQEPYVKGSLRLLLTGEIPQAKIRGCSPQKATGPHGEIMLGGEFA